MGYRPREIGEHEASSTASRPGFVLAAFHLVDDPSPRGPAARPFVPDSRDIESLMRAAAVCKGCDLDKDATPAAIVLSGEQPGDQEDRQGLPFVGPAGRRVGTRGAPREEAVRRPELRIGCSGWNYKAWRGAFYPVELPQTQWLRYYTQHFDTVEANSTFYRLPEAETFSGWADQTPPGFLMAVKASRYLTHMKKLREPEAPLQRLFDRAAALGSRLGPVLYQLPGFQKFDRPRLERFLHALPGRLPGRCRRRGARLQHVLEFRDPSWYVPDTFALLNDYGVALCLHDKSGADIDVPQAGPVVYVRFHGTSGHYAGSYGAAALNRWARRLAADWQAGRDVYAYFNNDPDATATRNARSLRRRVEALVGRA